METKNILQGLAGNVINAITPGNTVPVIKDTLVIKPMTQQELSTLITQAAINKPSGIQLK